MVHVTLKPNSQEICRKAADLYFKHSDAQLCPAAGHKPGIRKSGQEVMTDYFKKQRRYAHVRIKKIDVKGFQFRTAGEMQAFATMLRKERMQRMPLEGRKEAIYVVARWWHLPRAKAALRKALGPLKSTVEIRGAATPSGTIIDVLAEYCFAWPKNIFLRDV